MYGRTVLVAAAVLAGAGCEVNLNSEGVISREVKTFTVTGQPDVQVQTFDGAIEIHSWDRDEVEIEIEKRAMEQGLVDEMHVEAQQQGDTIVLKVSGPSRRSSDTIQIGVHFSPTARLRIALPRSSNLDARTDDGAITIEDVTGRIALNTSDGTVRLSRVGGDVIVRSGDGAIRLDSVEGKLDLETDDGSIAGEIKATSLRAHTGDGSVRLELHRESKMDADWDVQTSDGTVVLTLPSDFAAELDAESRDGAVRTNHPAINHEAREGDRQERRRSMRATLGAGGKILKVRTGDGSIRIES